MRSWFVYLINGIKIGTWANNNKEAEKNLREKYGDVSMEFVGISFNDIGIKPDKVIHNGMSPTDMMIASGTLNMLVGLRYV